MSKADRPPRVIIIDHDLDEQSGLEFARAIRASGAPTASLILLTSLTTSISDADRRLIDRVVTKPVKSAALVRAVAETHPSGWHKPSGDRHRFRRAAVFGDAYSRGPRTTR
jgi:CheY-like chemotaxis protein